MRSSDERYVRSIVAPRVAGRGRKPNAQSAPVTRCTRPIPVGDKHYWIEQQQDFLIEI